MLQVQHKPTTEALTMYTIQDWLDDATLPDAPALLAGPPEGLSMWTNENPDGTITTEYEVRYPLSDGSGLVCFVPDTRN